MAHGEHAAVNAVKAAGAKTAGAPVAVDPSTLELLEGDHAVLPRSNSRDDGVRSGLGAFYIHVDA